ncbi:PIR Superfamily Protein [Plasmodium ovale wallikeri]|uniref:PIR Superfamily Protein n=2 Tax=Plasmodium ovale TaxID=36330 RepID=A0A1A9ARR0_PLAOA|nr:PIR Superfamily Protein [Plasmodium ovale wallikeri]SBT58905.1 PIR Superfamily Protein [Plasmodium ovale wallikeri]SBT73348.1 PIR protein [Plasmodium ovale]
MATVDEDLSILPSFRFYHYLENGYGAIKSEDQFWELLENGLLTYTDVYDIHDTLLNRFYLVTYMEEHRSSYNERWNFVYYWVGEKLYKNPKHHSSFAGVIGILNTVKNKFDKKKYDYAFFDITLKESMDLKKIYDYSENYSIIEKKVRENSECTKEYIQYIKESIEKYDEAKSLCEEQKEKPFCKIFDSIREKYENDKLSKLKYDNCKIKENSDALQADQLRKAQRGDRGPGDTGRGDFFLGRGDQIDSESEGNTLSNPDSSVPSAVIFPLLGVFLVSFVLYKFTPFGTWSRTHLQRKNITEVEESDEFSGESLTNTFETPDMYSHTLEHNIGYHSMNNV